MKYHLALFFAVQTGILYFILLYSIQRKSTRLDSVVLYSTLFYSTLFSILFILEGWLWPINWFHNIINVLEKPML